MGVSLLVVLLIVVSLVALLRRRTRADRFEEIPSLADHLNNEEVMTELRRIAGPEVRQIAGRFVDWARPVSTKADVLSWLAQIPAGSSAEQFEEASRALFRRRGLPSPR